LGHSGKLLAVFSAQELEVASHVCPSVKLFLCLEAQWLEKGQERDDDFVKRVNERKAALELEYA
jgi:hypothetical protein